MNRNELKDFLDHKAELYESPSFIETDPIQLVHRFHRKEDIEIAGFLIATIAWGNRKMIITSGERLLSIMGESPFDFIMEYSPKKDYKFTHRTFNSEDLTTFFRGLNYICHNGGLEQSFGGNQTLEMAKRILLFRSMLLSPPHFQRSEKHIADPSRNSACKRINMFLRWMVRSNQKGVDFGIWESISPKELYLPLDVHTSRNARDLGLLNRKQDDWKALEELMSVLREFDPEDPVKYDFALFGIGAFEKF
ncbi:MAG: TIGR02757 family protein [Bacteroidetes bacterium]|nr:MAG: TIGR02757 family protein [Bacteroidota bacterium]